MGNCAACHKRHTRLTSIYTLTPNSERRFASNMTFRRPKRINPAKLQRIPEDGQLLSEFEKFYLRTSWRSIEEYKIQFGLTIYLQIFKAKPDLKILFTWDELDEDEMLSNSNFQNQAAVIMDVIERNVTKMDAIMSNDNREYLFELGRRHARFRGFGFTPDQWDLFGCCISEVVVKAFDQSDSKKRNRSNQIDLAALKDAWQHLLDYITYNMKDGYDDACRRHNSYIAGVMDQGKVKYNKVASTVSLPSSGQGCNIQKKRMSQDQIGQSSVSMEHSKCSTIEENTNSLRKPMFATECSGTENKFDSGIIDE